MADSDPVALLCFLHPATAEKREKTRELFADLVHYYKQPRSQCTTWTYLTHATRKGAPRQILKQAAKYEGQESIVGIEIYSSKKALASQQNEPAFKKFGEVSKVDGLFAAEEELTAWYPARGFIARGDLAAPFGGDVLVNLVRFVAKEGETADAVNILGNFADWVNKNEPNVLSYSIMTRPKAPQEIFMLERYRDIKALAGHGGSPQFKAMFKDLLPHIDRKMISMSEYSEWAESFVGNVDGGGAQSSRL